MDEVIRQALSVEVPADSFGRVWAQVQKRLEQRTAPAISPWELMLAVHQLRFWVRLLGVGLAGATVALMVLLFSGAGEEEERQVPPHRALEEESGRRGWLSWSPSPEERDNEIKESYGLLQDNRVLYSRNPQKKGGL